MIKTLIATGLITANIMGAVNTNGFKTYLPANEWNITENTTNYYEKTCFYNTTLLNNDIIQIDYLKEGLYTNNKQTDAQTLAQRQWLRIIPKLDVTKINVEIDTELLESQLMLNIHASSFNFYSMNLTTQNQKEQADALFNLTAYNTQTIANTKAMINATGNQVNYSTDTGEELNEYARPTDLIYLMTQNTPALFKWELSITNWYDENTPSSVWDDQSNFLLYTPGNIQGNYTYNYTIPNNYEVIDIPGLLYEILGMPFAFMSYAFNLTLWPNTPYAINLSHVFLALIVSGIIIFIIKKVYK